jgi:hypothetical protein
MDLDDFQIIDKIHTIISYSNNNSVIVLRSRLDKTGSSTTYPLDIHSCHLKRKLSVQQQNTNGVKELNMRKNSTKCRSLEIQRVHLAPLGYLVQISLSLQKIL